jgi:hypothetical protein
MLSWLRTILRGKEAPKSSVGQTVASRQSPIKKFSTAHELMINSLDDLIKTPGKACYRTLVSLATSSTRDDFVYAVHCPAFVGSGIRDGELERVAASGQSGKWQKTQMFNPSMRALLIEGASIEQSIFLLRKPFGGSSSELRQFTIGRTQENDILMNDFAISRSHAIVELRGEDYYLKDLGSSNGTYVNGKLIEDRGTLLRDGDAVRFARYDFIFLSVEGLFELLRKRSVAAIDSAP